MMFLRFPQGLGKALTLSYDDGVEQDGRLISILNRHGIKGTFNLNSGLFAPEGTVYPAGQIHRRMTLKQAQSLYLPMGHEVAGHCVGHESLTELSADQATREVLMDRMALERDFGGIICGMAYPFGTFDDGVVDSVRAGGMIYARTVISSHRFDLPRDWLRLEPTCHHDDPQLMALADKFLSEPAIFGAKLFYLWGHAYEFEANNNWPLIEDFCAKMADHSDVWYATNIEIAAYALAWRQLVTSADGHTLYNPTALDLWFDLDGAVKVIHKGETMSL